MPHVDLLGYVLVITETRIIWFKTVELAFYIFGDNYQFFQIEHVL